MVRGLHPFGVSFFWRNPIFLQILEERSVALCGGEGPLECVLVAHTLVSLISALRIVDFDFDLLHDFLEVI